VTEPSGTESFYVSIAAEAGEADLVADIVFAGRQVAAVRRVAGVGTVTLYDPAGSEGFELPLDTLRAALREAAERLPQERSE
jgi:hypothetical protein